MSDEDAADWREEHDRNSKGLFDALKNERLGLLKDLHGCVEAMNRTCMIQYGRNHSIYDRATDILHDLWHELEAL